MALTDRHPPTYQWFSTVGVDQSFLPTKPFARWRCLVIVKEHEGKVPIFASLEPHRKNAGPILLFNLRLGGNLQFAV